jgi:DNA-directed RNA polymerase subunit RPC12/RpoP
MRITLHCLDCGFRFSVTVPAPEAVETVTGSLSCGQCGSRRWSAA